MKTIFTTVICLCISMLSLLPQHSQAQCGLAMTITTSESRCKATGEVKVTVTGGSGNYNYKLTKGSFSTVTSSNIINGLTAGVYSLEVKDLTNNCIVTNNNVVITGDYEDPRFQLVVSDITCTGASNGAISVTNLQKGRGPFTFTVVSPSASAVGTTNSTGTFTNLIPGDYYVRLTDSCGGIQTRAVTVADYSWVIDSRSVVKIGCDSADASVVLRDSRGNLNTSSPVFNSFTYGVTRAPGDTSWYPGRSFRFYKGTLRRATILAKDACGNIKSSLWTDTQIPTVGASVSITNQVCAGFNATITGQANLVNPQYCLFNNANVQIACNSTGVFTNIAYGSYCIRVRDNCYDTTISRCFTVTQPVPNVSASVTTSNLQCNRFDASITGQQNLTNPQYCLFNSSNVQLACNSTGNFNNLPYGSYCIQITDGCTGTVINRCFTRTRPVPSVNPQVTISNRSCSTFSVSIGGQVNISNGQYCIYDVNGVQVDCNNNGNFNNLPYGSYCLNIVNNSACYDTTMVRCFTVSPLIPSVSNTVSISNQNCNTFTASITGQLNLNNPQYCLYDNTNALITCNTSGTFSGLAYGSYCIRVANSTACYDTTIQRCFTATRPVPAVGANLAISNRDCNSFRVSVTSQSNLTNPQYCLFNNSNVQVACNSTGTFNNVPYGAYCIYIVNSCYDTTITRCFNEMPIAMKPNVISTPSCNIGTTDFSVSWAATVQPYILRVYNPVGTLVRTVSSAANSAVINGLPALPVGMNYKVIVNDNCGNRDSTLVQPNASWFTKSVNANSKCPSGQWQNGSGDITVFCQYSNGTVMPRITQKNFSPVNISYNFGSGFNYSFTSMEPATYVIEYTLQNCSSKLYDTFSLNNYAFPALDQSGVYQCNNSSFGVNAVVNGGISPFKYEIIGSYPSMPSIVSAPQNSPSFNLNNGSNYSVVRLRATDACGNATINDASIMPLANTLISATSNCFYNNITLNVDTVPNATYAWYKRINASDSVLLTSGQSYNIAYLLPTDTGTYICKVSLNNGCLSRVSYFNLDASCGGHLLSSNEFSFKGSMSGTAVQLSWVTTSKYDVTSFVIERSVNGAAFTPIGTVKAVSNSTTLSNSYLFSDGSLLGGKNYYRIRIIRKNGAQALSNILVFENLQKGLNILPNPVESQFKVRFNGLASGRYSLSIISADGKQVFNQKLTITGNGEQTFQRPENIVQGTYFLVVQADNGTEKILSKIVFR